MPAFYRTSEAYSTPIDFPADPSDNDVFEHPGGWQYQYDAETTSWALVGSRGVEAVSYTHLTLPTICSV